MEDDFAAESEPGHEVKLTVSLICCVCGALTELWPWRAHYLCAGSSR